MQGFEVGGYSGTPTNHCPLRGQTAVFGNFKVFIYFYLNQSDLNLLIFTRKSQKSFFPALICQVICYQITEHENIDFIDALF